MPYKGAKEYPMLLCLWHFGGTDMKSEKTKDMSIYIYLMYIIQLSLKISLKDLKLKTLTYLIKY